MFGKRRDPAMDELLEVIGNLIAQNVESSEQRLKMGECLQGLTVIVNRQEQALAIIMSALLAHGLLQWNEQIIQ